MASTNLKQLPRTRASVVAVAARGMLVVGIAACAATTEALTMAADAYRDKVHGAWLGALIGNYTGLPNENRWIDAPSTDASVTWSARSVWDTDDDTSMEWTFLHMMETNGLDSITCAQIAAEWLDHFQTAIWYGNETARNIMVLGKIPPETGHKGVNGCWNAIDAQIQCEVMGELAPGMLTNAMTRQDYWGRVVADRHAVDTSKFYAILCADAFFTSDPVQLVERAKSKFANTSLVYEMANDVQTWRALYANWRDCRLQIWTKYNENSSFARLNFCATLMALLYGGGDWKTTVQIACLAGWDCDCNAATAGTILGIVKGYSGLPTDLVAASGNTYRNTNRANLGSDTLTNIVARVQALAEQNIVARGGSVTGSGADRTYTIVDGAFTVPDGTQYCYDDDDPEWTWGTYTGWASAAEFAGTIHGGNTVGAYGECTFCGTDMEFRTDTDGACGSLDLFLDGLPQGRVSLRGTKAFQVLVFRTNGLVKGFHTFRAQQATTGETSVDYVRSWVAPGAPTGTTFTLAPSSTNVVEGAAGTVGTPFSVSRGGSTTGAVSVGYATVGGAALAGSDFVSAVGTLNWAAGDGGEKTFTVAIRGDTTGESNETFTVALSSPTGGATLGVASVATITILNDDPLAVPTLAAQPLNQTVAVGNAAAFSVTALGLALLYLWQASVDGGATWSLAAGATTATCTTPTTVTGDNGKLFRCVVANSGGAVTSTVALLTVTVPVGTQSGPITFSDIAARGDVAIPLAYSPQRVAADPSGAGAALPTGITISWPGSSLQSSDSATDHTPNNPSSTTPPNRYLWVNTTGSAGLTFSGDVQVPSLWVRPDGNPAGAIGVRGKNATNATVWAVTSAGFLNGDWNEVTAGGGYAIRTLEFYDANGGASGNARYAGIDDIRVATLQRPGSLITVR